MARRLFMRPIDGCVPRCGLAGMELCVTGRCGGARGGAGDNAVVFVERLYMEPIDGCVPGKWLAGM